MESKNVPRKALPYRSTLRAQAAADTRRSILDTAMRLFPQIWRRQRDRQRFAAGASLAPATVYAGAGGKAAVLATLIDEAMRDPTVEETVSAVRSSRSGYEVLRVAFHGVRVDNERYHDIVGVMKNAAAVDTAAMQMLQRSDTGYRQALGQMARRLRTTRR